MMGTHLGRRTAPGGVSSGGVERVEEGPFGGGVRYSLQCSRPD